MEVAAEDFDFRRVDDADFVAEPGPLAGIPEDAAVMGNEAELFASDPEGVKGLKEDAFCDIFEVERGLNRQIIENHERVLPKSNT